MPTTIAAASASRHRELPEKSGGQLAADLRKAESRDYQAEIGACLSRARHWVGWSLKEVAAKLHRDERQIARWENGSERTQVDAVFAVEELREPFCVQLAKLSGADVCIHVAFKRSA